MAKADKAEKTTTPFTGLEEVDSIPTVARRGRTQDIIESLADLKKGKSAKVIDFSAAPHSSTAYGAARSLKKAAEKAGLNVEFKVVDKVVYASR